MHIFFYSLLIIYNQICNIIYYYILLYQCIMEERKIKIVREPRTSLKSIKYNNSKISVYRGLNKMLGCEIL